RAADREERSQPGLFTERFQAGAPLDRAFVVADALAGGEHVAARETDRDEIRDLAGDNRGVDFVETPHAFGDGTRCDERHALHRYAEHLEVDVAACAGDANALASQRVRAIRIAVLREPERCFADFEPRLLRTFGKAREDASRALQPSVR